MEKLRNFVYKTLRLSERYTKTDMIYLARGGFWLTFGQVITAIASFVLSIVFANILPKVVYGNYRYITSLASTLSAFSLTGIGTAVVQSTARGNNSALNKGFWLSIRWSLLLVLISFGGAIWYYTHDNITLAISMLFIGSLSPIINASQVATYFANGKKDFRTLSIYNISKGIFPIIVLICTVYLSTNIIVLIATYFISNALIGYVTYFDARNRYTPHTGEDADLGSYSKKISSQNILAGLAAQADKVLIFNSIGAAELAVYSIALAFPEQAKAFIRNLGTILIPKLAEKGLEHTDLKLKKKMFIFLFFLFLITILYIFLAPFLFEIFFPAYTDAVVYSRVYALSILATLSVIPSSILLAHKKAEKLFIISVVHPLFQITLTFIFLHLWGLMGVVVARVIASYFILGVFFFLLKKDYKL